MIALVFAQSSTVFVAALFLVSCANPCAASEEWPTLPARNAKATIPAQEWSQHPGQRNVPIEIFYPGGELSKVNPQTGIFLTLHNWGGTGSMGTADPAVLTDRYNVIAVTVDYLQSGPSKDLEAPYDFGYFQALDALRALYFIYHGLETTETPFGAHRIYVAGGSGGGNVALMCNKLAPRTFACVVDLSGMAKLSDDIAFGLPGGSSLNAGYSRDPRSPNYLSADAQQLRFIGDPDHLQTMLKLGNSCRVIVVHGMDDTTCPAQDAQEMVKNLESAGLAVEPHFIEKTMIDGKVFQDAGHRLGNRTQILQRVADDYLLLESSKMIYRRWKSDFDLRDDLVRYRTANGQFVISYKDGYPVGHFE